MADTPSANTYSFAKTGWLGKLDHRVGVIDRTRAWNKNPREETGWLEAV